MPETISNEPGFSKMGMLSRKWLRLILVSITYYTGLVFLVRLLGPKPKVRILMYHSINNDPSDVHSVTLAAFEDQMRFLATNHSVISPDQLINYLDGKESVPDNSVVITFDDGLENNYTTAYPILKKYNLPAAMFIVPSWITSQQEVEENRTGRNGQRYMMWEQIQEIAQDGVLIGAHTINHRSLPTLTPAEIRYDLSESKARLEQQLDQPIKFFAYPYGAFRDITKDIMRMVAECGYTCAITSLSGTNSSNVNRYALRRTEIEVDDGMYVFSKAMAGALDCWIILQRLRWVVQQILKNEQEG